jgi:hypothetical protein
MAENASLCGVLHSPMHVAVCADWFVNNATALFSLYAEAFSAATASSQGQAFSQALASAGASAAQKVSVMEL